MASSETSLVGYPRAGELYSHPELMARIEKTFEGYALEAKKGAASTLHSSSQRIGSDRDSSRFRELDMPNIEERKKQFSEDSAASLRGNAVELYTEAHFVRKSTK